MGVAEVEGVRWSLLCIVRKSSSVL